MKPSLFLLCLITISLALAMNSMPKATVAAVTCNPMQLSPCAGAILSSAPPTAECCAKLKEQQPCFCQYKNNPILRGYINSGNSKKVADACGVPMPNC